MISDFKQIINAFKEINTHLTHQTNIYLIGGAVLLYHGIKPATKDIDIILPDQTTFTNLLAAMTKLGYKEKIPTGSYKKMQMSTILENADNRFDLFVQKVCKKIVLTTNMKKRSTPILQQKYLNVFLCSNEDIFIFKSITERSGDLEDCAALAKRGINWEIILHEIQNQIQHSKEDIWITWIGERMDILQEEGINIPIMKKIDELRDTYFDSLEKKIG